MEKTLSPLQDTLGSACTASVALAWSRRDTQGHSPDEDLEHYVASLTSLDQIQAWYNASRLGLTPKMQIEDAFQSCQCMPDALWNHLVQLHPKWQGDWNVFALKTVAFAASPRAFQRFEACREVQGMEPWDWTPLAPSAKKFESMLFFWGRGFRPLAQWQLHWIEGRRLSALTPAKKAREDEWNAWMVAHVLPGTETTPLYAQVYPRIRRMPMRSAHDWALPERWRLMREKMPWLHLAAAWHNDTCWLPAKAFHDPAWCDYAALLRLQHPQSFRAALPDVAMDAFIAPMQATLEAGHSVGWTWPMLLAYLEKPDTHNEESLALPGDLLDP